MATSNTKTSTRAKSKTTTQRVTKAEAIEAVEAAVTSETDAVVTKTAAVREEKAKSLIPTDIDQHTIVTVRNGFQGRLAYVSRKTGEQFIWEGFGDEQDMEIGELRNARNSNKKFFINNWFMFDEPWIPEYLGLSNYYKFAISISDFDALFEKSADEAVETIEKLSAGQKASVAYRARQLIAEGGIDSNKMISALEKVLGTQLVERD